MRIDKSECGPKLYFFSQDFAETASTLIDPLRRRETITESDIAGAETVGVERGPRYVRHSMGGRASLELVGIESFRKGEPHEETTLGMGPRGAGWHVVVQSPQHGVPTFAVHRAELFDLAFPIPLGQVLRDGELGEDWRA